MSEPITRRRFLRDSAIATGAVVLLDPSSLFAGSGPVGELANFEVASAFAGDALRRPRRERSTGVFAQVEYGDGQGGPIARWTRLGEDFTLVLLPTAVVFDVPTRSESTEAISLDDFERGRGHHEVVVQFGEAALEQLRTEVAYLRLFAPNIGQQAA